MSYQYYSAESTVSEISENDRYPYIYNYKIKKRTSYNPPPYYHHHNQTTRVRKKCN